MCGRPDTLTWNVFENLENIIVRHAVVAALLCMLMCGCGGSGDVPSSILPGSVRLRPGDVVLRRGGGLTSRAVLFADAGGSYSHVGIVADSAGQMMVVHAVPGEPDRHGDPDRVKMEPAAAFFAPWRADIGCVMRCVDSAAACRAAAVAVRVCRRGTLFDHDYDGSDTTRMYCCELVEFAYRTAGLSLTGSGCHDISIPGLTLRGVILPSDFVGAPALRRVAEF